LSLRPAQDVVKTVRAAEVCLILVILCTLVSCERKPSIVRAPDPFTPSAAPTSATSATPAAVESAATPSPQRSTSIFVEVAQPVRAAVVIVSVFDETGHLSANGHGFFVSADGKFIADRSIMTGGVNAVAKVADGAIYNVSGALTQAAPQNLVLLKADTTHPLPFLVPSASALPDTGDEVAIVLSPIERTNPVLLQEKISGRFTDVAREWFDVTPALSKTIAGAPVINQRGELIGVVAFRGESNSCVIRPAAAAATLLSQVSPNMTASWQNLMAASRTTPSTSSTPARTGTPSKIPLKGPKLVYAPAPRYPSDAKQPLGAGQVSGSFRVSFDANGEAVAVQTIRSTGNSTLDQAAVSALQQWRSEAGHEWSLVVPITFKP
jgi:TonB family protein